MLIIIIDLLIHKVFVSINSTTKDRVFLASNIVIVLFMVGILIAYFLIIGEAINDIDNNVDDEKIYIPLAEK